METLEEFFIPDPQVDPSARALSRHVQEFVEKASVEPLAEEAIRGANDIFRDLLLFRTAKSEDTGIPLPGIFSRRAAQNISISKPSSMEELLQVRGVGSDISLRYGEEILEIINDGKFSKDALEEPIFTSEQRKSERKTTYPKRAFTPWSAREEAKLRRMHKQGKTPQEISDRLNRTVGAVMFRASKLGLNSTR
ncbi:MAG: HRDC domain-containing protein [Anaerolineales bacterium]|nr:HRDC domain-containing protein [Anaerolineales bacterium]